jgi:hypothetical protein
MALCGGFVQSLALVSHLAEALGRCKPVAKTLSQIVGSADEIL